MYIQSFKSQSLWNTYFYAPGSPHSSYATAMRCVSRIRWFRKSWATGLINRRIFCSNNNKKCCRLHSQMLLSVPIRRPIALSSCWNISVRERHIEFIEDSKFIVTGVFKHHFSANFTPLMVQSGHQLNET